MIEEELPFYSYLISLSKELKDANPNSSEDHIEYLTNIKVAKYQSKEIDVVVYNSRTLELDEVKQYLNEIVISKLPGANSNLLTPIRRLATAYDLLKHGDLS